MKKRAGRLQLQRESKKLQRDDQDTSGDAKDTSGTAKTLAGRLHFQRDDFFAYLKLESQEYCQNELGFRMSLKY
jgi:hypothetical protein